MFITYQPARVIRSEEITLKANEEKKQTQNNNESSVEKTLPIEEKKQTQNNDESSAEKPLSIEEIGNTIFNIVKEIL